MKRSIAALVIVLLAGCEMFHSDSENFIARSRAERAKRIERMRAATLQAPAGESVGGRALTKLLSGRTHVFIYGTTPGGHAGRYVEYFYFATDGHYVYMNTEWAKDPKGHDGNRWRVRGERLCILNQEFSAEEQCYRLSMLAGGRIEYFISKPGDETDGLVTRATSAIEEGPPKLEEPAPAG